MATHSKKVSKNIKNMYQVFTNDTSASGAVTFATGDYIDFKGSLGRAARGVQIILKGTVAVELQFNTQAVKMQHNLEEADTSVTMPEEQNGTNTLRLFTTTQYLFTCPAEFPVENIKLVAYSGVASGTQNLTIIGF